jgi:hypothetical protein
MRELSDTIFDVILRRARGSPIWVPDLYPYVAKPKPFSITKFDVIPSSVPFPDPSALGGSAIFGVGGPGGGSPSIGPSDSSSGTPGPTPPPNPFTKPHGSFGCGSSQKILLLQHTGPTSGAFACQTWLASDTCSVGVIVTAANGAVPGSYVFRMFANGGAFGASQTFNYPADGRSKTYASLASLNSGSPGTPGATVTIIVSSSPTGANIDASSELVMTTDTICDNVSSPTAFGEIDLPLCIG